MSRLCQALNDSGSSCTRRREASAESLYKEEGNATKMKKYYLMFSLQLLVNA